MVRRTSVHPKWFGLTWVLALSLWMFAPGSWAAAVADAEPIVPSSLQVGAYYYPWYGHGGYHWNEGYIELPLLGEYSSRDSDTIGRHIAWARDHGIDFFAVSWWGLGDYTDLTLRNHYLRHPDATDVPIALLYEVRSSFRDRRIDFDDPYQRRILARDMATMANLYFDHPAYFRIDGKPVVFIYLTRIFIGDYAAAVEDVREAVAELGYDLFLIGDEVYWGTPQTERAQLFDAVTAYNMHTATLVEDDFEAFQAGVDQAYRRWREALSGLPQTRFIPKAMPGFDDSAVRPEVAHPRLVPSPERFRASLQLALEHVDPELPLLMITSFNEWHEDTQIEPSERYGEAYLEMLAKTLQAYR